MPRSWVKPWMNKALLIVPVLLAMPASAPAQSDSAAPSQPPVVEIDRLNPSLPSLKNPPNLETPQACVENFVFACREEDYARAARSLNFRLLEPIDEARAARAAERLFFVLNQELWIDWESLPDRADGMDDRDLIASDDAFAGKARRSIRLGSIDADGRSIPIRIQRVKPEGQDPVWVFSAQTVDNIKSLYATHGPGWVDRNMPEWARERWLGRIAVWKWIILALSIFLAPLVGYWTVLGTKRIIVRTFHIERDPLKAFDWPIVVVVTSGLLLILIEWGLSLPSTLSNVLDPLFLIIFVGSLTWLAMRILTFIVNHFAKNAVRRIHDDDTKAERRLLTQLTVARHVLMLVVVLVAVGIIMMQLDIFRSVGIALISSAGAAAVLLGIAGHAVLGNLIAGLQIALTQPFALGDTVYVEDNWGHIEDITYTFVVVNTWDERRLVIPIKYFVNNWFENWSLMDTFLIKPIYLRVDYRTPVEKVREKFLSVLEGDEDWDKDNDEPEALVTEMNDDHLIVRLTCGGANSSEAWSLHCRIYEKMVAWLQEYEGGQYLPRERVHLTNDDRSSTKPTNADSALGE